MRDWTVVTWRSLVFCTLMTGLAAVTGLLWLLPSIVLGLALLPGLLVALILSVAGLADHAEQKR